MLTIKQDTIDNIIVIIPIVLMVLLINDVNISVNIKADTIILVLGNLAIAVYIASVLNKKYKNNELKLENCFKELISLEELLQTLRTIDNTLIQDDYILNRHTSLIRLQVSLISKYIFIDKKDIEKLLQYTSKLDEELTGDSVIDNNYKNTILQFEKRILVIKSNIL